MYYYSSNALYDIRKPCKGIYKSFLNTFNKKLNFSWISNPKIAH